VGAHGGEELGGRSAPLAGGLSSNSPPSSPATVSWFKMRAKNSLGALVTWAVSGAPDDDASEWSGGNTPLTDVGVAARWSV